MLRALKQSLTGPNAYKYGFVLVCFAGVKALFDFFRLIFLYVLYKPINWDTLVYLTIGRGILNGMKPYSGLYEMKPPGIFLISALSLGVTGNEAFGLILQHILYVSIPVLSGVLCWFMAKKEKSHLARFAAVCGVVFGILVSLYAETRAAAFQSEGFGFFFAFLYVIAILWPGRMSRTRTIFAALGMVGSLGFKEPFFLSALASGVCVSGLSGSFWQTFKATVLWPLLYAGFMGLIIMLSFGYLHDYFTIHLPFIFSSRLSDGLPLPLRGLAIGHVLMDTFIRPLFGFGVVVLSSLYLIAKKESAVGTGLRSFLVLMYLIISMTLLWFVMESAELVSRLEWQHVNFIRLNFKEFMLGESPSGARSAFAYAILLLLLAHGFWFAHSGGRKWVFWVLGALYIASLAVAAGGFFGSHMLFVLPLYCTFFYMGLRHVLASYTERTSLMPVALPLLCASFIVSYGNHYDFLAFESTYNQKHAGYIAERFDAVMQSCELTDYFVVGDGAFLTGHSAYSPMGPLAFQLPFMDDEDPMLAEYYNKGLSSAEVAVVQQGSRHASFFESALPMANFSVTPPLCAQGLRTIDRFQFYYRMN